LLKMEPSLSRGLGFEDVRGIARGHPREEAAAAGRQPLLPHKIARRESGVV